MTDPMYAIEKFGLGSAWLVWQLARGGLDQFCTRCRGEGVVIRSPCVQREPRQFGERHCSLATGCPECRSTCPECRGSRLLPPEPLHAEDFGDKVSLDLAKRLVGDLVVSDRPRIDRKPMAL